MKPLFDLKDLRRIKNLEVGDIFVYFSRQVHVIKIKEGFFCCKSLDKYSSWYVQISCLSQQKVEYIGNIETVNN